ncbi:porin family protein [Flavobacterium sp. NRK1]|uniref:porin family protein n=1 Tax=Flavobacterium sp. NRK1 TaxID=2954929 RepID=UPI0020930E2C|nr:porin family protein [Flavobacterium sp. NRK1]MCO6148474.1 PorT family protein [Flavobacterium sp. NRK1]
MKKILLSAAAVIAFSFAAQAQSEEIKFGVKAGANFTNFGGDADTDGKTGFYVGALADLPISGNFHIQPEVQYSNEGADDDNNIDYIRIPIMAKYYVMEGLSLQAGPEVAFKIAADDFVDEATKSIDFGLGGGVGYELPMGLFFDARYNVGLSNISDVDGFDLKNTGFQIGAGYRF